MSTESFRNQSQNKKIEVADRYLFGRKLAEARVKSKNGESPKTFQDIAGMIGVSSAACSGWESGQFGLPNEEKLGRIAVAYGISGQDYYDLIEAYEISKNAHELDTASRKRIRNS